MTLRVQSVLCNALVMHKTSAPEPLEVSVVSRLQQVQNSRFDLCRRFPKMLTDVSSRIPFFVSLKHDIALAKRLAKPLLWR